MKKPNPKILATLSLATLLASPLTASAPTPYTPDTLFLTIYADGDTVVEYILTVNTTLPRITVPLFGQLYTDMVVTDGEVIPLDYTVKNGTVTIDTLGASEVNILYTTPDLIDKEGAIWTLHIEAPITFSARFPQEATIIGMSSIPVSITSTDNQYILTMNPGQQTVSYSTGVVGTKEQASITIKNTEIAIEQAKAEGITIQEAEEELDKARQAYSQGRYIEAEQSASKAKMLIEQALTQPTETSPPPRQDILWISWIVAATAVTALIILLIRRKSSLKTTYEKKTRTIDVAKILQGKLHLRPEDKETIQYLADSGGEVFETELREHFKLPKTTIWRLVRRLQREGLVEVRKTGGQNLIRIKEDQSGG